MINQILNFKVVQLILAITFVFGVYVATAQSAHAADPVLYVEGSHNYQGTVGESVRLTWNSAGHNNCQLATNPSNWQNIPNVGSRNVNVESETVVYTIRCARASGGYITGHFNENRSGRVVINPDVSFCPWTTDVSQGRYVVHLNDNIWSRGAGNAAQSPVRRYWTSPSNNGSISLPAAMRSNLGIEYDIEVHTFDQDLGGLRNDRIGNYTNQSQEQEHEEVTVQILNGGRNVVYTSQASNDLSDVTSPQQWGGTVANNVLIPASSRYFRARLSPAAISDWSPSMLWDDDNSVDVSCVKFERSSAPSVPVVADVDLIATPEVSPSAGSRVVLDYDLDGTARDCVLTGPAFTQINIDSDGSRNVYPNNDATFEIVCDDGAGGTVRDTASVTVSAGASSANISASPSSVTAGDSSTITWSSNNVDTCTVSSNPAGVLSSSNLNGSQSVTVNADTTFTIDCDKSGTSYTDSETVTVSGGSADNTVTIVIDGSGDGDVTGEDGSGGTIITCGADCLEDVPDGTEVTLVANPDPGSEFTGWTGGGCSGTGNCTVTVNANITITAGFDYDNPSVRLESDQVGKSDPGDNVVLTWTENAGSGPITDCDLVGEANNVGAPTDSYTVSPTTDTTYTIECTGPGGTGSAIEVVEVKNADDLAASMVLIANPSVVRKGSPSDLEVTIDPLMLDIPGNVCGIEVNGVMIPGGTIPAGTTVFPHIIASQNINAETVFTLNCSSLTTPPPASASATVRVLPVIQES